MDNTIELIELIEGMNSDTLRAYFTEIMVASLEDDPNTLWPHEDEEVESEELYEEL